MKPRGRAAEVGTISNTREGALARAFSELQAAPGFKGAVILYLTEDAGGLVVRSNLPGRMVEKLIQEAAAFSRGERGSKIVIAQ